MMMVLTIGLFNLKILWIFPSAYCEERLAWVYVIFLSQFACLIDCFLVWLLSSSISSNDYNDDGIGDNDYFAALNNLIGYGLWC